MHKVIGVAAFKKVLRFTELVRIPCIMASVEGIEIQMLCSRSQSLAEMEKIPHTAT